MPRIKAKIWRWINAGEPSGDSPAAPRTNDTMAGVPLDQVLKRRKRPKKSFFENYRLFKVGATVWITMFSWGYYVGNFESPPYDSDERRVADYVLKNGKNDANDPTHFVFTCTTAKYVYDEKSFVMNADPTGKASKTGFDFDARFPGTVTLLRMLTEIGDAIDLSASASKRTVVVISAAAAASGFGVGAWLGYTPKLNCDKKSIQKFLGDPDFWKTYVGEYLRKST